MYRCRMDRCVDSRDFPPGSLWNRIEATSHRALASGALEPVTTRGEVLEDEGMPFQVRILDRVDRAAACAKSRDPVSPRGRGVDPFLPPDPRLLVGGVGPDHFAVLNKYPVLARHLLLVTRRWEEQTSALTESDFEALARCMTEYDGLGFYNSGRLAGASQRHKHLQLVPLPLGPGEEWLPIERLMKGGGEGLNAFAALGVRHGFAPLEEALVTRDGARAAHRRYRDLLAALQLDPHSEPYNLLTTRGWLLLIPRRCDRWEGTSVNALGFAGALLVRDRDELDRLRAAGPWEALRAVALPRSEGSS